MDTVTIKIDHFLAAELRRKCKNIKLDSRIILDLTAEMLLSSLEERQVPKGTNKGHVRLVGKDDHMTDEFEISRELGKRLHVYLTYFDVSLSRIMNDALSKMKPNVTRLLPINSRTMGCLRHAMFLWENGKDPLPHKSAEAKAIKQAKEEALASKKMREDRSAKIKKELGPEEDFEVISV